MGSNHFWSSIFTFHLIFYWASSRVSLIRKNYDLSLRQLSKLLFEAFMEIIDIVGLKTFFVDFWSIFFFFWKIWGWFLGNFWVRIFEIFLEHFLRRLLKQQLFWHSFACQSYFNSVAYTLDIPWLRGHNFALFWPPPTSTWTFLTLWTKKASFGPPTISSCQLW